MRIVNRVHLPWFLFVVFATLVLIWLYIGNFTPQTLPSALRLPDSLLQKPSENHRVGGTPLGLIFGTIVLSIFVFAALLGVRKKIVLWRVGTVQRWLRAHIWLTLLTVPLVILHSGFRLGGPMTTLIIILYVVVMVSGIYFLVLQHYVPTVMMERLPAESVYEQIPHIRAQLVAAATKMRDSFKPAPPTKADAGAPAPSPAKAVTAGSAPMASTAADLSTPTARAKSVVGSTIIAETIARPEKRLEEKIPPPRPPDTKPPETMGTPTARVPEGAPVPAGTEKITGVAPPSVEPRSVAPPTPIAASAAAPGEKPPPATVAQPIPKPPAAAAPAAEAAIGVGGATDFGSTDGGATPVIFSVPAGTGAPSGTRAVGVPIVSGGFVSGGRGGGIFSSSLFSGRAIVSAMIVDPTTLFARAVGVLKSAAVEAIGADPAVTAFAGLGAGAPASALVGGAGLNESRIFVAAATSCARMCGICS